MKDVKRGGMPGFQHVDHIALTVSDLDAASKFYCMVFDAEELYRLGPFDAEQMPRMENGSDWTKAHVNVSGAKLSIAMLGLASNLMLELFQYDKPDDAKQTPPRNCDIGGHHIALKVESMQVAIEYLSEKGCTVLPGQIDIDEGPSSVIKVQYVLDPWGNQLELVEYEKLEWMDSSNYKAYGTN